MHVENMCEELYHFEGLLFHACAMFYDYSRQSASHHARTLALINIPRNGSVLSVLLMGACTPDGCIGQWIGQGRRVPVIQCLLPVPPDPRRSYALCPNSTIVHETCSNQQAPLLDGVQRTLTGKLHLSASSGCVRPAKRLSLIGPGGRMHHVA